MGGERMGANPQSTTPTAVVASQQAECFRLQAEGLSIREIARQTGLSVGTVHKRISAQAEAIVQPERERAVARQLEYIQKWLDKLDAQINQDYAVARNIEVGIRALEREAKLLGIDAPEKTEVTVTEITQEDVALAELVAEAKAVAANAEARIRGINA